MTTMKVDIKRLTQAIKRVCPASLRAAAALGMPTLAAHAAAPPNQNDAALIAHGEYLARGRRLHRMSLRAAGKPFAGGLKFDTPIGAIYSTNITPDRNSGIGAGPSRSSIARCVPA